jgi:hypothetical protein
VFERLPDLIALPCPDPNGADLDVNLSAADRAASRAAAERARDAIVGADAALKSGMTLTATKRWAEVRRMEVVRRHLLPRDRVSR